ncbi:hypothetical protein QVD17_06831 [Tagetes erecta]|uniref:Pentatricopeptide repeat-containing protein n=1 Tax=Tagetes erecta TaxID=13708 RepID=A0AAD8LP71_TARER|nr:hypothetical protein QVD17_06831 [Tagetes erecta]
MFAKLQHLDTNCTPILHSFKPSKINDFNAGVSVSVSLPRRELEQKLIKKHQIAPQNPSDFDNSVGFCKPKPNEDGLVETPVKEKVNGRVWLRKKNMHTKCSRKVLNENEVVKNVHTRCLMKWARYGGCIPAILEALERVGDLDEAFKPWELSLNNKEMSIILKEQKGWERAKEIFEWFKRKGCYELNVIHYNIMIRILGKARKWVEVEMLWDEMEKNGIESVNSTFGTLIDVYSKGGVREKAMHSLDIMNKKEMEPDEVTMGIIVQMYKTAGQFEKAEEFFKSWLARRSVAENISNSCKPTKFADFSADDICLSSYTYNRLIDTYGKAGRLKDASDTFELMLRKGVLPNVVTFNTMIHMFGNHGRLEEVASLMHKMEELQCVPDTRTYNILISLHVKHDDIIVAKEYFKKMQEAFLEPDAVSYRTLLYAFSTRHMVSEAEELVNEMNNRDIEVDEYTQSSLTRMYIESGMLEKSWLWFLQFHIQGKMSPECYAANIDAFGERGHILEAEKVFSCCQERRNPTVLEFNVMIKAYGINQKYEEACQLVDSMDEHGVYPDKCSYNSLIQMLASTDHPQKATFYLRKMQESGLVSDCIPYCAVISSFVKLGQLEMAVSLFEEMVGFSLEPDVVAYGVLINAYADIGSVEGALHYANEMKKMGLAMNDVICKSLIKLYTKVGCLKEAEEAYYMLQRLDVGPDVYSSNCMIDLYTELSMVKPAEEIFEKLRRNGNASEFSYAMMLCMYKKIGSFDEAIEIAKQMRELGLLTDLLSYNHVLGLYALDGRFQEAVTIFMEMIESGVQPNDSTFKSLGVVLMKRGVSNKAVKKLEVIWRNDYQSGLEVWQATLNSVIGMVNHDSSDR